MISIIVPVFNQEKYLPRFDACIKRQTFRDFEVIFIDDGSADGSGLMLDEMVKHDDHYQVVHKENGGVSSARNVGLSYAKGEFLTFMDPDDTVTDVYLESIVAKMSDDIDMVCTQYLYVDDNEEAIEECHSESVDELLNKEQIISLYYNPPIGPRLIFGIWNKLFRTQLIRSNNIKFDEGLKISEDMLFLMQYVVNMTGGGIFFAATGVAYLYNKGNLSSTLHNFGQINLQIQDIMAHSKICLEIEKVHKISIRLLLISKADVYKKYKQLVRVLGDKASYSEDVEQMKRVLNLAIGKYRLFLLVFYYLRQK